MAPPEFHEKVVQRVEAPPERAWEALVHVLPRSFDHPPGRALALALGADPSARRGTFPEPGAALPGFAVADASPPTLLVLAGRHRHARYSLTFHLEPDGDATRLAATTAAEFPGLGGRLYRKAVVLPFHRPVLDGLLRAVARRAAAKSVK